MEKRFFIDKNNLTNDDLILTDDEHLHLSKVLRLKVGDEVECFYDNGPILKCEILNITKQFSSLKVREEVECNSNPKLEITVFQGLPKLDKLELITQKLTELGITKIIPFSSSFCIAKENLNKIDRLKKIIVSACKQCGRTKLTQVENPIKFKQMIDCLKSFDVVIFANETEKNVPLKEVFKKYCESGKPLINVACIVGSEGGFSKEEIETLCQQENVYSVSLGSRILRAETASIVLAGLIAYELGEI